MRSPRILIHLLKRYALSVVIIFAGLIISSLLGSLNTNALEIEEYQTPTPNTSVTYSIETSAFGVMWFTKSSEKQIVKLDTDGSMVEYPMTTFGENISQIKAGLPAVGPDGNVWYLSLEDDIHSYLNRINPDGSITSFELKTIDNQEATPYLSHSLALGPDGNIWIGMVDDQGNYYIAKYDSTGEIVDEIATPDGRPIFNIKRGVSGTMWYLRGGFIGRIGSDGNIDEIPMPNNSQAFGMELGSDGNIWFTGIDDNDNQVDSKLIVGKITPQGEITIFPTEELGIPPAWSLDLGPDGRVWFSSVGLRKVVAVSVDGSIEYYDFSPFLIMSINKGPDNNMWALSYDQDGGDVIKILVELDQELIDEQIISNNLLINPPSSPKTGSTTIGVIIGALFVAVSSLLFRYFGRDKTREINSSH